MKPASRWFSVLVMLALLLPALTSPARVAGSAAGPRRRRAHRQRRERRAGGHRPGCHDHGLGRRGHAHRRPARRRPTAGPVSPTGPPRPATTRSASTPSSTPGTTPDGRRGPGDRRPWHRLHAARAAPTHRIPTRFAMEPAAGRGVDHHARRTSCSSRQAGFDAADFATEPKQDEPYIMWDGTPYEHLMVPVVPMAAADMGDADADMQNTMSAAPAGIIAQGDDHGQPDRGRRRHGRAAGRRRVTGSVIRTAWSRPATTRPAMMPCGRNSSLRRNRQR